MSTGKTLPEVGSYLVNLSPSQFQQSWSSLTQSLPVSLRSPFCKRTPCSSLPPHLIREEIGEITGQSAKRTKVCRKVREGMGRPESHSVITGGWGMRVSPRALQRKLEHTVLFLGHTGHLLLPTRIYNP